MKPFTYCITHKPSGKRYYGSRYRKGCSPDDLGTKYFSSSKLVQQMIKDEGLSNFTFEVRKTFSDRNKCIDWELKVLRRMNVAGSAAWLNQCNGTAPYKFHRKGKMSEEHRRKISEALKGRPKSDYVKQCVAEQNRRRVYTDEMRLQRSIRVRGEKNPMYGRSHYYPDRHLS